VEKHRQAGAGKPKNNNNNNAQGNKKKKKRTDDVLGIFGIARLCSTRHSRIYSST
jgi:hypothetical protein